MPYHQRRRSMRRSSPRAVVRSFKKIINIAPTGRGAGTTVHQILSEGKDSITSGQVTASDTDVPTGSIIKFITIQYAVQNLADATHFQHIALSRFHAGQTLGSPDAIGGSDVRNQTLHQELYGVGWNQNANRTFRFKIPPKYQRVRAGDRWYLTRKGSTAWSDCIQIIYKFYQ